MQKNALELVKEAKQMGLVEFCKWLGISHNTYKKIVNNNVGNTIYVDVFIKINKKTGLDICDIIPHNPLCELIKK